MHFFSNTYIYRHKILKKNVILGSRWWFVCTDLVLMAWISATAAIMMSTSRMREQAMTRTEDTSTTG